MPFETADHVAAPSHGETPAGLAPADAVLLDWARAAAVAPWSCGENDQGRCGRMALTIARFSMPP